MTTELIQVGKTVLPSPVESPAETLTGRSYSSRVWRKVDRVRIEVVPGSSPIACSLEGDAARKRWEEWTTLLMARLRIDQSSKSLAIAFPPERAVWDRLARLVAAERECCGFVEWDLEDLGSEISLTLRGDVEGLRAMAESFGVTAQTERRP